jgi:hypothetical protein
MNAATTPMQAASQAASQATAAPARPQQPQPLQLPALPRKQRLGAAIASVLISTVLLSSVVIGLTSAPESGSHVAAQPVPAQRA